MKKIKLLIILIMFFGLFTTTYCVFTKSLVRTGSIITKELSATLLDNNDFLTKLQVLDPSITTFDKTTDLNLVTTLPSVTFTSENILSTTNSSMPVFVWVDNGTVYYYSGATNIDLNNN